MYKQAGHSINQQMTCTRFERYYIYILEFSFSTLQPTVRTTHIPLMWRDCHTDYILVFIKGCIVQIRIPSLYSYDANDSVTLILIGDTQFLPYFGGGIGDRIKSKIESLHYIQAITVTNDSIGGVRVLSKPRGNVQNSKKLARWHICLHVDKDMTRCQFLRVFNISLSFYENRDSPS